MTRILSALVLGGAAVAAVLLAPPAVAAVPVALLSLVGTLEMAGLLGVPASERPTLAVGSLLVPCGALGGVQGLNAALLAALAIVFTRQILTGRVEGSAALASSCSLALLFPSWSLSHALLFLPRDGGRTALLLLLAVVWACDTAAYYGGTALGRRRLAPFVSPNKTVEGLACGLAGGAAVAAALRPHLAPWLPLPGSIAAGLFLSALGQAGDLFESLLKRDAGVKDSGAAIPGHGGVLDRIDALLFALPLSFYGYLLVDVVRP